MTPITTSYYKFPRLFWFVSMAPFAYGVHQLLHNRENINFEELSQTEGLIGELGKGKYRL
jgi:hypothetical protein